MADSISPDVLRSLCALEGYQPREVVDGVDALFRLSGILGLDPAFAGRIARMAAACPHLREAMKAVAIEPALTEHVITAGKIFLSKDGPLTMVGIAESYGAGKPDLRFRLSKEMVEHMRDHLSARLVQLGVSAL